MNIQTLQLTDLKPLEVNVRKHTETQIKELIRSLEQFGQTRAIVIDEDNNILIGNGLHEAMTRAGMKDAAVYRKSGLSDIEKKKLILADNKICKREPNAYMAMLYFDTEFYRRKKQKKDDTDYKGKVFELFNQPERFTTPSQQMNFKQYRRFVMMHNSYMDNKTYKVVYQALIAGDPKKRTFRSLYAQVFGGKNK